MKIEISNSKKGGTQVTLIEVPRRMDSVELTSIIEEAIVELQDMQTDLRFAFWENVTGDSTGL